MSRTDLIVLVPWPALGTGPAIGFLLLRKSRCLPSPRGLRQSAPDKTPGPVSGSAGQPAGRGHPGAT